MSPLIKECIRSWHKYLPDWEFVLWNEENTPLDHPFVKKALKEKKYAFVADYVRSYVLYNYGGVYLDTDMELIRDISPLINCNFFAAYEDSKQDKVSCGIIGSIKEHEIFKEILNFYDMNADLYKTMPYVLGGAFKKNSDIGDVVLPPETFYPYNPFDPEKPVKQLLYSHIKENTYGIHHWGYSWKFNFFERFLNKIKRIKKGL
ncbi:glycosyltransferase family 32 protein [Acinetobacter sp. GXMZU3951]